MIILPVLFLCTQADDIMARVAENQNRAQQMRTAFVYHQSVMIRMNRSNGKLAREESSEYTVTPTLQGIQKERTLFNGKYFDHGKEVGFDKPGYHHKGLDIDADLADSLLEIFTNDKKSRDGIEHDLFPLTTEEQCKYDFQLEGTEDYRGTPVYRITFTPKKNQDEGDWKGEALIDREEYQPVLVTTSMAQRIPMWVKTVFGTDVKHIGFKVTYKKFDSGLWFPVTYGGEFQFKALFLYARRVGVSMQNSAFQRSSVESKIAFDPIQ